MFVVSEVELGMRHRTDPDVRSRGSSPETRQHVHCALALDSVLEQQSVILKHLPGVHQAALLNWDTLLGLDEPFQLKYIGIGAHLECEGRAGQGFDVNAVGWATSMEMDELWSWHGLPEKQTQQRVLYVNWGYNSAYWQ